jgi:hypothetical protein
VVGRGVGALTPDPVGFRAGDVFPVLSRTRPDARASVLKGDPALAPLHSREDFQRLVQEVERKSRK